MHIVHVSIHVKPEHVEAFKAVALDNARHSRQEPGVISFDLLQQQDDPTRFRLVEIYRTPDDQAAHRQTDHFKRWFNTVTERDMFAEPRTLTAYTLIE
jgi:(4S)-4-hydroxy-5-phosphonooxypentane-2,3-dione isomerase